MASASVLSYRLPFDEKQIQVEILLHSVENLVVQ